MMLRLVLCTVAGLASAAAHAVPAQAAAKACPPVVGLDAVLTRPSLRWLVVGEQHGTNEMPAMFRNIVCHATATKRPLVIAIERSASEQADIDTFLRSDGGQAARAALTRSFMWQNKAMQDGRGSRAYLQLISDLRVMYRRGAITKVVAFQPNTIDHETYEKQMAKLLETAAVKNDSLVLSFVGNCHAAIRPLCGKTSAAAELPKAETFTINLQGAGGSAWNCAASCAAHQVSGSSPVGPPRIEPLDDPKAPWDALLFLGQALTASPPAVANMNE